MPIYETKRFSGDYDRRQREANAWRADLYIEQHVNSSVSESPDYGLGVVAINASMFSRNIAKWYAAEAGQRFDVGGPTDTDVGYGNGIRVGGRGNGSLVLTDMPAFIAEPWFASNPKQAERMNNLSGANLGAHLLVDTIYQFFPNGGKIAFSVGHAGKTSNPNDRGAAIIKGRYQTEAGWATAVVKRVMVYLEEISNKTKPSKPKGKSLIIETNDDIYQINIDQINRMTFKGESQ